MASAPSYSFQDWRNTLAEFLVHLEAHRAPKTVDFYKVQLRMLISWAEENNISQDEFGKRHMDRYLAHRATKVAKTTLHHDGVAAKSFFKWAVRNDLAVRNPLADYEVRKAPTPPKYMPTEDDVRALLRGAQEFWNPRLNASSKYYNAAKRTFHRDRNFALLMVLLDMAIQLFAFSRKMF